MRQIFVDMDGVLADFDTGHERAFGVRPSIESDNVDWELVRNHKDFYRDLPPMPDAFELWRFLLPYDPIILTGVPRSVEEAADNKAAWVVKHLGEARIICCRSSEKCLHARRGDVLIDDWDKYKHKWLKAGGVWITHINAATTIAELSPLLGPMNNS